MNVLIVFSLSLATALATGLGALPVVALSGDQKKAIVVSSALASARMLGASAGLFYEGTSYSVARTALGAICGAGFIIVTRKFIGHNRDVHIGSLKGARNLTAVLVIVVMTVHSFTEGVVVGVSFAGERSLGIAIAVAIAVHNIPEGVAISLALMPHGASLRSVVGWSILSSLPQPLMAVPAYLAWPGSSC